ncbi:type II toxin-antitoxin system VapC family toxin [soil metagenome]
MIVVDVNLLIYAVDSSSPRHPQARDWLEGRLSGTETMGFAWSVLTAFIRLSTRASVFERPLTPSEAFDLVDGWLAQPPSVVVHPTERHSAVMREILARLGVAGNLVPDAHLAALALEHGAELASSDHDFARFARLRWADPLAG